VTGFFFFPSPFSFSDTLDFVFESFFDGRSSSFLTILNAGSPSRWRRAERLFNHPRFFFFFASSEIGVRISGVRMPGPSRVVPTALIDFPLLGGVLV